MTKPEACQTPAMTTRVDRDVLVLDPVEMEACPAPVMQRLLEAEAGVEEPFPGGAGDDEGQRHRIEIDRPQHAFAADLLVEQDGQEQAERQADARCRGRRRCAMLVIDVYQLDGGSLSKVQRHSR